MAENNSLILTYNKLERVKCRFSECRFSVELKKSEKYSRWGAASKNKSQKPWACSFTLPPCGNRCRFSESALFSASAPTIENKIERKNQNTKVACAKVAFDTVRINLTGSVFPLRQSIFPSLPGVLRVPQDQATLDTSIAHGFLCSMRPRKRRTGKTTTSSCPEPSLYVSISTGLWCIPAFGAGYVLALKPSKLPDK